MHIKTQCHLHTSSPQPPPIPVKFSTRTRPGIVDLKFSPANYLLFTKRPKSVIPSKHKWKRLSRFTKCPCFNFIKQGLNYSRQHRSVHTTRDWGLPSSLDIKAVVGFIKIKSEGGGGRGWVRDRDTGQTLCRRSQRDVREMEIFNTEWSAQRPMLSLQHHACSATKPMTPICFMLHEQVRHFVRNYGLHPGHEMKGVF